MRGSAKLSHLCNSPMDLHRLGVGVRKNTPKIYHSFNKNVVSSMTSQTLIWWAPKRFCSYVQELKQNFKSLNFEGKFKTSNLQYYQLQNNQKFWVYAWRWTDFGANSVIRTKGSGVYHPIHRIKYNGRSKIKIILK